MVHKTPTVENIICQPYVKHSACVEECRSRWWCYRSFNRGLDRKDFSLYSKSGSVHISHILCGVRHACIDVGYSLYTKAPQTPCERIQRRLV